LEWANTIQPLEKGKIQGRCDMYQYREYKETIEVLRKAGFSHFQIERIVKFRRNFVIGEMDRAPTEYRRLEFARWLFLCGKLNDMGE
jgi:hypothetical protein